MTEQMTRLFGLFSIIIAALIGCSAPPDLVGVDNPDTPVASAPNTTKAKVFMLTTRAATDVTGVFYSGERAPELSLTSVTVSIPPNHENGQIERPKQLPPDPSKEFAIINPTVYGGEQDFISELNRELAKRPQGQRDVLLFVHGYNTTTSDALLRIAQFAHDSDFEGIPVLFSWASAGKVTRYVYDINSSLVARRHLLHSASLISQSNAQGVDLFAHSMGTFLTVEALVQANLHGPYNQHGRLKNVMLASPDIDIDLFKEQLKYFSDENRNLYLFVSDDDKALKISRRISGGVDRVGSSNAHELSELGVTVLDLSEVDDSNVSTHSKFAESPEVVALIGQSLENDNLHSPSSAPTFIEVLEGVPIIKHIVP